MIQIDGICGREGVTGFGTFIQPAVSLPVQIIHVLEDTGTKVSGVKYGPADHVSSIQIGIVCMPDDAEWRTVVTFQV